MKKLLFPVLLILCSLILGVFVIVLYPESADFLFKIYAAAVFFLVFIFIYLTYFVSRRNTSLVVWPLLFAISFSLALITNAVWGYWEDYLFFFLTILAVIDLLRRMGYLFKKIYSHKHADKHRLGLELVITGFLALISIVLKKDISLILLAAALLPILLLGLLWKLSQQERSLSTSVIVLTTSVILSLGFYIYIMIY